MPMLKGQTGGKGIYQGVLEGPSQTLTLSNNKSNSTHNLAAPQGRNVTENCQFSSLIANLFKYLTKIRRKTGATGFYLNKHCGGCFFFNSGNCILFVSPHYPNQELVWSNSLIDKVSIFKFLA